MIVMGVDPGTANTGFGVVRVSGTQMVALDGGVIEDESGNLTPSKRLDRIHRALSELIEWHEPEALAVEELYFGRNVQSAIAVGQARGVALLAAAQRGVPCFDYTPQAVKMAVCGSGGADKKQVQRMVAALLRLPEPPHPDHAADALAVAICHASSMAARGSLAQAGEAVLGKALAGQPSLQRQRLAG
jgi:crossover junction endodeoxyribonuclease RuvC